ncbi:MAG: YceI family protein [Mucilaginibacter sp.]|nr:YceI family protein [Mucilaginibacter sp.]
MKKLILISVAFIGLTAFTQVQELYKTDAPHSQLHFTINHLGISDISGTFDDFEATLRSGKADFSDARFELTAKTISVDTRVEQRDHHLRSADFLDTETYPTLVFKSAQLKPNGKNKFKISGNLTLHGVTKPVTLELAYGGTVLNPANQNQVAGFTASGIIRRSDFGIGPKFPAPLLSDDIRIVANGEFIK